MAVTAAIAAISTAASVFAAGGVSSFTVFGLAKGFTSVVAAFLSRTAIGVALNALTPKPKQRGANRGYQVTTKGSALDQQIIYGRVRVGGVVVYDKTIGTNNKFLHRVIAFAGHEIESFDELYIDDDLIEVGGVDYTIEYTRDVRVGPEGESEEQTTTVSMTGVPSSDAIHNVGDSLTASEFQDLLDAAADSDTNYAAEFSFVSATILTKENNTSNNIAGSKYRGKLRINEHLGTEDQVADSDLVSETSGETEGKWTSNHRLRGIAYLYVRLEFDQNVFPNGIPNITATIKGKKVFDPRNFQTYWSDNPALCLRDYIESSYGLSEDRDNIDGSLVRAAADVCGDRNTVNGEKRYTCNGAFVTQVTPLEILNDMLTSMGGLLWYAQGKWRMKPAYYVAPTLTFTEDDLRSSISVKTRHSRRDNFNIVKGTFRGEESNWQVTDFPEVTNSAFVAADNGQESVLDLELPFTDNADEARRIARIVLERNRQQLTVSASFGLRAFKVQTGDIIKLSIDRFGWAEKEFEVTSWTFGLTDGQDLQVQMTLREISESVFDEVDDGIVYERDNTTLPNPFIVQAPQNLSVTDGGFTTDDGTFVNSFIVDWDAPDDSFVDHYELEWRIQNQSVFKTTSLSGTEYEIYPVAENQTYEVRVKAVNTLGVSSPYSGVVAEVSGDGVGPNPPSNLTSSGGYSSATISWDAPTQNTDGSQLKDLFQYKVYRGTSANPTTLIGRVSGELFTDSGLGDSQTYYYRVKAVDFTGNESAYSNDVSVTTNAQLQDGQTGASTNIIFIRSATAPQTPSDSVGVPSGWSDSPPLGTDLLWASKGTKSISSSTFSWTTPFEVEGRAVTEVAIYRLNNNTGVTGGSYDFTTQTLTPPSGWSTSPPSLTSNGDVIYRASGIASGGPNETSADVTYSTSVVYATRIDGIDGTDGQDGADGDKGDTVVSGLVYYQILTSTQPAKPSATNYDTSSGSFTDLTAGWGITQPSVEITDTTVQEWKSSFTVTIDGATGTQTIEFSNPVGAIQVTANIESDNFVSGSSGWQIKRDTGNAEFNSVDIRDDIQSTNFSSGSSGWRISQNGNAEFNSLITRSDLVEGAATDFVTDKEEGEFTPGQFNVWVTRLLISLGPVDINDQWKIYGAVLRRSVNVTGGSGGSVIGDMRLQARAEGNSGTGGSLEFSNWENLPLDNLWTFSGGWGLFYGNSTLGGNFTDLQVRLQVNISNNGGVITGNPYKDATIVAERIKR